MAPKQNIQLSWVGLSDPGNPMIMMSRFYQEVVEIKRWIEQGKLSAEVAEQLRITRAPSDEEIAEVISLRLQRWLEQARLQLDKVLTDREMTRINEAIFVMAALADELFVIELDWPGKSHWQSVLLEERLFNSSFAGERFFLGVTRLLQQRTLDKQQQQLAAVYLLALRLGFRGRYREQTQRLSYFRQQLFKRINTTGIEDSEPLTGQAYNHRLVSWQEQRLAPLTNWYRVMALGGIAYLIVGWGIWLTFTGNWA